jgi:membrane protein implicated in regulation of membrane protease activity
MGKGGRMMEYIVLWVAVSIVALVIDLVTSSFFFAGFTIGGIAALIARISNTSFVMQIIIFGIVSAISITIEYLWVRKKLKASIPKTPKMEETYIGRTITLDEDLKAIGKVKLDGIYWSVENQDEPINAGEEAEITGIKGNKIIIKKK